MFERLKRTSWTAQWFMCGMVCVMDSAGKSFELKNGTRPENIQAVGCGGWDEKDRLHWVGIDLDVGHGRSKTCYATTEDAIEAASRVREFVGGAAEIRLSKSGSGVHIRTRIAGAPSNGRVIARRIAWWLAAQTGIKTDHSVLGRQNLWLWAKEIKPRGFELVLEANGEWTPPAASLEEPEPAIPAAPATHTATPVQERARRYLGKMAGAVSGQGGHDATFHAACVLILGFGLSIDDARPVLQEWNTKCQPPWSERELNHKLTEAAKQAGERGHLLKDDRREVTHKTWQAVNKPVTPPSEALACQVEAEIAGKRYAAKWPWHFVEHLTLALMPGTVTVLCAPKGSGKTFLVLQGGQFWHTQGYNPAILMLEEDREFHLRRALAHKIGNGAIGDPEWVKNNPDATRQIIAENKPFLDSFGACIHEVLDSISTESVLKWVEAVSAAGSRVVVIDPITAKDPSERQWIDDHRFMMQAKRLVRRYENSLVLVAHPPKTISRDKRNSSWGDDVAGGMAYQNFSQTILWLEYMAHSEDVSCTTPHGTIMQHINRKLQIRKTRSKEGQGYTIGFFFDGGKVSFEERGIVDD